MVLDDVLDYYYCYFYWLIRCYMLIYYLFLVKLSMLLSYGNCVQIRVNKVSLLELMNMFMLGVYC